jgi:hypothetical protein
LAPRRYLFPSTRMNKLCYTERGKTKRAKLHVAALDVAEERGGVELKPVNTTGKKCGPLSSLILYDCRVLLHILWYLAYAGALLTPKELPEDSVVIYSIFYESSKYGELLHSSLVIDDVLKSQVPFFEIYSFI